MSAISLHVTNGDSVLHLWKKAGLLGTHLAWKDALHEGPVPAGMPLEALSRVRADYLALRGYGNAIKIHRDFEKRDATLRRAQTFDEIVLWFEHDLSDQLQILQILRALHEIGLGAGRVELVQADQYLGMLAPEELMALYARRRFLTSAMERDALRAWDAFTSDSPEDLTREAAGTHAGFPFMRDALKRLCEEYPATGSGLSRTQRQLLEASAQGARRREDLFRRSQAREEASFLSDAPCYAQIAELCAQPAPLLVELEQGFEPTVLGRHVLAGDADWLELQPVDRWIGGVHLTREYLWRWDERTQAPVKGGLSVQG